MLEERGDSWSHKRQSRSGIARKVCSHVAVLSRLLVRLPESNKATPQATRSSWRRTGLQLATAAVCPNRGANSMLLSRSTLPRSIARSTALSKTRRIQQDHNGAGASCKEPGGVLIRIGVDCTDSFVEDHASLSDASRSLDSNLMTTCSLIRVPGCM